MKIKSTLLTLFLGIIMITSLSAQMRDNFTIQFETLGNCYTCKLRIEAKLNTVPGISAAEYDPYTDITTVTYDDLITDAFIIMQAVADTGHDTEWFMAPDAAYELLIGTCCEYERIIDYTQVQVGYLSLMDLWMPHVSVGDQKDTESVRVYPTASTAAFNIDISELTDSKQTEIKVYSLSGSLLLTQQLTTENRNQIDLSFAPSGQYIITLTRPGKLIYQSKIVKL